MMRPAVFAASVAVALLAGCDVLGIESPQQLAAARDAEGRAVGAACRHAGRAIEDCFRLNLRAHKPAVVAGWIEMNDYMRENKLEPVAPVLVAQAPRPAEPKADARTEPVTPADARAADPVPAPSAAAGSTGAGS